MAKVFDQFPRVQMPALPEPIHNQHDRGSLISLRLTDMSMASEFSLRDLIQACGTPDDRDRGSIDPMLTSGTLEIIRQTQTGLEQIETMDIDELEPSSDEIDDVFDLGFTGLNGDQFTDC